MTDLEHQIARAALHLVESVEIDLAARLLRALVEGQPPDALRALVGEINADLRAEVDRWRARHEARWAALPPPIPFAWRSGMLAVVDGPDGEERYRVEVLDGQPRITIASPHDFPLPDGARPDMEDPCTIGAMQVLGMVWP